VVQKPFAVGQIVTALSAMLTEADTDLAGQGEPHADKAAERHFR